MNCAVCNLSGLIHVDHIIPISKGGTNEQSNLQPLCSQCNYRKGNRKTNDQLFDDYIKSKESHIKRHAYLVASEFLGPFDPISNERFFHALQVATTEAF